MPEAGHESVEEDRRGSVSEGLFRVHLRSLQLESSRRPLTFSQSASELADKINCQHDGRESTKSRSPWPRCAKTRTARHQQCKKEIALSTDRKARPPDCFLHLAAQQRQNTCGRRLFHQSAVAERSAELVTDFAFTTDESIQGSLSV
jgi:hypothetical protein